MWDLEVKKDSVNLYFFHYLNSPYTQRQEDMAAHVLEFGVGEQVTLDVLLERTQHYLHHEEAKQLVSSGAKEMFSQIQGARERTWQSISQFF